MFGVIVLFTTARGKGNVLTKQQEQEVNTPTTPVSYKSTHQGAAVKVNKDHTFFLMFYHFRIPV